ncbi:hypothetical protein SIN8267_02645 [Sinobacterium norvegicum]|uniref:Outer membrane protein beta-barrel domain-containing protein n=1 Tax=Sinobacterium norvegicum TaxID=1641715 RepID=A0ABN8ELF7_9GAMM|nr:outer membrane beta-barrel domain-containing protein [Sinobacterium norvegicum]CAH0992513.1 hypothetical protein SIN8267_02645 [Sinobacterium norvegicum]
MENRLQRVLLATKSILLASAIVGSSAVAADGEITASSIDSEVFDAGVYLGVVNIDNFSSEAVVGAALTFQASESFFLQFTGAMTAETAPSSYEKSQGELFTGSDRSYRSYDFLLGYKLLKGEVFLTEGNPSLGSLYLIGGVGNSDYGGESNFTYTVGVGYQIEFMRRYVWRLDYRDRIYSSDLLSKDKTVHNTQLTTGLSYLF